MAAAMVHAEAQKKAVLDVLKKAYDALEALDAMEFFAAKLNPNAVAAVAKAVDVKLPAPDASRCIAMKDGRRCPNWAVHAGVCKNHSDSRKGKCTFKFEDGTLCTKSVPTGKNVDKRFCAAHGGRHCHGCCSE